MPQPDEIPDEAAALAWLPELDGLLAFDGAPALAEALASGEAQFALGETPVELHEAAARGAKAPSWDEPPASAEAHWVSRARAAFPPAGEVWIGPQSAELAAVRDVVLAYSREFPPAWPVSQGAGFQARAVPRLVRQQQADAPPEPCKK